MKAAKSEQTHLKQNEKKWSKALMEAGFTVFPAVILDRQQALGLEPVDMNIILQLANYWWQAENLPRPSKDAIAKRIGVSAKTVQRRIAKMEAAGFIQRRPRYHVSTNGQQANSYDFSGLITAAQKYAEEEVQRREDRRKEELQRATRKKPNLRVVKGEKG
jgi:predicted transcriptional regulator